MHSTAFCKLVISLSLFTWGTNENQCLQKNPANVINNSENQLKENSENRNVRTMSLILIELAETIIIKFNGNKSQLYEFRY